MTISYTCDWHFKLKTLNLMNIKNQPNAQIFYFYFLIAPKIKLFCFQNFHMIYNIFNQHGQT
jgi:hypothetical protein